jgi:hypothetical protein
MNKHSAISCFEMHNDPQSATEQRRDSSWNMKTPNPIYTVTESYLGTLRNDVCMQGFCICEASVDVWGTLNGLCDMELPKTGANDEGKSF